MTSPEIKSAEEWRVFGDLTTKLSEAAAYGRSPSPRIYVDLAAAYLNSNNYGPDAKVRGASLALLAAAVCLKDEMSPDVKTTVIDIIQSAARIIFSRSEPAPGRYIESHLAVFAALFIASETTIAGVPISQGPKQDLKFHIWNLYFGSAGDRLFAAATYTEDIPERARREILKLAENAANRVQLAPAS